MISLIWSMKINHNRKFTGLLSGSPGGAGPAPVMTASALPPVRWIPGTDVIVEE
jgi:hypothetical protein